MTIDDATARADADAEHAEGVDEAGLVEALIAAMLTASEGRLKVEREIACGGVGAIHAVFDGVLQRPVAKKTLLAAARANPVLVRAFLREASITAQLDHPNIVPVHDFGVDAEGQLYFTMRLVQGKTLAQRISEHHQADPAQTDGHVRLLALVEVVTRVCDALAFAHSRGVIHCDLKAENIMVGRFGQVYLMDWGFAQVIPPRPGQDGERRVRDPLPRLPSRLMEGLAFGTPGYMSPEQAFARLDALDERSDVFSIGALLYHVLAGHPPYNEETKLWRLLRAQEHQFTRLVADVAAAAPRPPELVRIIERAMARAPEHRYPAVDDLIGELQHFSHGGGPPSVRVAAGATIIVEGETSDAVFLIQSGSCEAFVIKEGRRQRLEELGPGDSFGEGALLTSARRLVGVAALTDAVLLRVPAGTLQHELAALRPWVRVLLRALIRRNRALREHELGGLRGRRRWKLW